MANRLDGLSETVKWRLMVEAAKQGTEAQGYTLARRPGRGLSNIWNITRDGKTQTACIRTTRDRWFAFPPLNGGTKWKTLDDVDVVILSAVNSKDEPERIQVYIFPAGDVRERFDAAYKARAKDNHISRDNFGMWISLDPDTRGIASSVGGGLSKKYPQVVEFDIADLLSSPAVAASMEEPEEEADAPAAEPRPAAPALSTIAEVMAWARKRVAEIAGVQIEAVKLELKLEY